MPVDGASATVAFADVFQRPLLPAESIRVRDIWSHADVGVFPASKGGFETGPLPPGVDSRF